MASPDRRVLSDKSTNASLHIRDHFSTSKGAPQGFGTTKQAPAASPLRFGTKRRFQEVDSNSQDYQEHSGRQQDTSAQVESDHLSKSVIEETDTESESLLSSMIESNPTTTSSGSLRASTSTVLTSFHASQEPTQLIEEQFEIVLEESQKTLEQIHATPMPEPKMLLPPPERPTLQTEGSQDSVRMSSFIDFDEADESQREKSDEDFVMITPPQQVPMQEESPGTNELLERATMLRTRLQLAMHKVETNQTSKPFSRLDKPRSAQPELSLPPRLFSAGVVLGDHLPSEKGIRASPESQIAIKRARAFRNAYQGKAMRRLNSMPVPNIVPTAYSARYMVQPQVQQGAPQQLVTEIPSSPPQSHGSGDGPESLRVTKTRATPSPQKIEDTKVRYPKTPIHQLSSPPGSEDGECATTDRLAHRGGRSALTSSVVKGEAANGLLELMRAANR